MDKLYKIEGYELLNQKIYRMLKTKIIKGNIKLGSKLLENKIAEQLGVSRTPVREAIQKLAAEGFVELIPNKGVKVSEISPTTYREVLQVRAVLEGLAAYFLAKKITPVEIKKLQVNIRKMYHFVIEAEPDPIGVNDLNIEFHNTIINNCGNNYLRESLNNLNSKYSVFRARTLKFSSRFKSSFEEHSKILEALKSHNAIEAERLSREHINHALEIFSKTIETKSY